MTPKEKVDFAIRSQFLKDLWLWKTGKKEKEVNFGHLSLSSLAKSEWSHEFAFEMASCVEVLLRQAYTKEVAAFQVFMQNRLIMGAFRYGKIGDPAKPKFDRVAAMERYFDKYITTGNSERLIDLANYCLLEYVEGDNLGLPINLTPLIASFDYKQYTHLVWDQIRLYKLGKLTLDLVALAALAFCMYLKQVHPEHHFEATDNTDLHCNYDI